MIFPEDLIALKMYQDGTMPNAKVTPAETPALTLPDNPTAQQILAHVAYITGVPNHTNRKVGRPSKHGKRAAQKRQADINRVIRKANGLKASGPLPKWVHDPSVQSPYERGIQLAKDQERHQHVLLREQEERDKTAT